jgi:outer membrane immunogenic protein
MRTRMVLVLTAACASFTAVGAAQAADLPRKAPVQSIVAAAHNWSGFYVGVHGGAAWGTVESSLNKISMPHKDREHVGLLDGVNGVGGFGSILSGLPISSHGINGFLGGGQAGVNWQSGIAVFGVEGQFSASNIEGTSPCLVVVACSTQVNWVATVAGRFGLAIDKALWYVKGGAAWADSEYKATFGPFSASASDTRFGVMFGTGVEYAVTSNWSAKIEYNYIDFGRDSVTFALPFRGSASVDIDQKIHLIKAGINYRFGGGPVVARY